MLQDLALGPDTVDVSMATLASVWACDPHDLSEGQHEPLAVWESEGVFNTSPPAGLMWMEQLSPHLQRNKQLQDTLLQREEELARLQEENNKLREFLGSSFVRDLEKKAKKLTADGRMKLKRNLTYANDGPSQNCAQLVGPHQVSKRVCRNLTAEFCSESHEMSTASEPNLDLWVLRTLGLKDRDTIDTSNESLSSSESSLRSLVYDTGVISCSEHTLNSSFSSSVAASTPSPADNYCQNATSQTEYRYSAECHEANCNSAKSPENCTVSVGQYSATDLTVQSQAPDVVIRSYDTVTAFQSQPLTELPFTQSPDRAEMSSATASSHALPSQHSVYWSPLQGSQTPSQETLQFSPSGEGVHSSPTLLLSSTTNASWMPISRCSLTSTSVKSQPPSTPQMPNNRTDLAFSMSLSPSSSVKTHSFPQGQAFVRKDSEGRWNFTWMPRQGP